MTTTAIFKCTFEVVLTLSWRLDIFQKDTQQHDILLNDAQGNRIQTAVLGRKGFSHFLSPIAKGGD